jgi:hypothetical protein
MTARAPKMSVTALRKALVPPRVNRGAPVAGKSGIDEVGQQRSRSRLLLPSAPCTRFLPHRSMAIATRTTVLGEAYAVDHHCN